jgi:hypothetical protein
MRFRARSAAVEGSGRWMGDNNKNLRLVGGLVFRSDVVGSLLRPASLKKAREQHEAKSAMRNSNRSKIVQSMKRSSCSGGPEST